MASFLSFLAFGTLWFWIFSIATIWLIIALVEEIDNEVHGTGATITLVVFLTMFFSLGNKDLFFSILEFIATQPAATIGIFIGYVVLGIAWSFVKWYFYLIKTRDYQKERQDKLVAPQFLYNKSKIITWMSYWPFSALWVGINKPFKHMYNYIVTHLSGSYQKMSDRIFKVENTK